MFNGAALLVMGVAYMLRGQLIMCSCWTASKCNALYSVALRLEVARQGHWEAP